MTLYHYTDTARLPFILQSGELRPGRNRIGAFPDPDFLWATTSPLGDRTSSLNMDALRRRDVRAVRFVLGDEDFEGWPDITARYPVWTPEEVARLERAARVMSDPRDWRCRADPLPRQSWLGIETRTYTDKRWLPLATNTEVHATDGGYLGVAIGGRFYLSREITGPHGSAGYQVHVVDAAGAAA